MYSHLVMDRERHVSTQTALNMDDATFTNLLQAHSVPRTPLDELEALMQAKPGEEPLAALMDIEELRDSVMSAWAHLSDEDQFILGASIIERLSYSVIATRMAVSKSQARRMAIAAKTRLEAYLLTEDAVRTRLGFEKSWNHACRKALLDLAPSGNEIDAICEWVITANMQGVRKNRVDEATQLALLTEIGSCAAALLQNRGKWDVAEMERLLCSKQADYGCENIKAFGMHGVLIRMSDKVARFNNLMAKGVEPKNESLEDTLMDLVGYAVVALMLVRGEFELPLETS